MSLRAKSVFAIGLLFLLYLMLPGLLRADGVQLVTNGNFATGNLSGWTEVNQAGGSGSFFVTSGNAGPLSGSPTPGPDGSTFYAVSDQNGPGAHALLQSFTVPTGATSLTLTFDMFVSDWDSGPFCNSGLDYTVQPNQCARVDILSAGAGAFDTTTGVLDNLYHGADCVSGNGCTNPAPWTAYTFDLTGLAPGTYQLRFAEADNQLFLNDGVDNVSLTAAVPAPEPSSYLLLSTGLVGLLATAARRKRHAVATPF
jgi:hypothetical protein